MPLIELKTHIKAHPETCFDLSVDIDLHIQSMVKTNETAIGGRTGGQIQLDETVKWKARHFSLNFTMTVMVKELKRPQYFTDEMINGPFNQFRHKHIFEKAPDGTWMTDLFYFKSPLGILGYIIDKIVLKNYMTKLLFKRNEWIKNEAEKRNDAHL